MLARVYRSVMPASVRQTIYEGFLGTLLLFIRNFRMNARAKFTYIFRAFLPKNDLNKALSFMGKHGLTSYPADYMLEYKRKVTDVVYDEHKKLHYCLHNGRKLYFTSAFTNDRIERLYKSLITEQDSRSAHRYIDDYDKLNNYTLLDVGSAEGIFTLDNIDRIKHAYLFEAEPYWIDALKATFEPWKEKITIVEKYVGDKTEDNFITLDDYLKDKEIDRLFLKMDIEGAELAALNGATNTLKKQPVMRTAICTYHRPGDPEKFDQILTENGFATSFSDGFLFWGKRLSKAVVRGLKGE
ncbi:MAG: FkbM family methyltransferase [Sphingomonadales bacterium]|nr:FkbM family methyltransferase [Sphingomonadales bacterium]